MKKGRVNAKFDEKYTLANRTFPVWKTILLVIILFAQIGLIFAAFQYDPQPQDIIQQYDVIVEPLPDGSLDITYHFVWEALDTSEELTWIEIGMANSNYTVYPNSLSSTIYSCTPKNYDEEVFLELDLKRAYSGGEVVEFSFKINQKDMLCQDGKGYFYEFVPGWFNSTPVENYSFRWKDNGNIQSAAEAQYSNGYYTWSGSFDCGGYTLMHVRYGQDSFTGCETVRHSAFNDAGARNSLKGEKISIILCACIIVGILIGVQVWIVDSVVSYHRGRGFLSGHGYYVHTYGRSNPYYVRERDRHRAMHGGRSGGRGGGGCACACACACAGGGRAGCSQKDTYAPPAPRQEA